MEKIKRIWLTHKNFICVNILCILFLSIYYGCHISEINTVWELHDEFGFLANADYLARHNWPQLITSYYGYGYSLLLIPLFYLCETSIQLIQGAVAINVLCVLLTYLISLTLMCKMCDFIHKNVLALVAAVLCLYPYLPANAFKVNCECFLAMLTWLIWLLLYQCLETKKGTWHLLLGLALSYVFFTHTRGAALTITVFFVLLILCIIKRVDVRKFLITAITLIVCFGIGYLLKNDIIAGVYTAGESASGGGEVINVINLEWILARVTWFFSSDFIYYIYAFLCKNFYLFVAGMGLCHWGIFALLKKIFVKRKSRESLSNSEWVEVSIAASFVLMLGIILFTGAGMLEDVRYFYYGRYFEYLLCPVLFLGVMHCRAEGMKPGQFVKWLVFWGICALGCLMLSGHLLNGEMSIDTNRIAVFSFVTEEKSQYREALEYLILYSGLGLFAMYLFCQREKTRGLILIPICILFLLNDNTNIQHIAFINERDLPDNIIANYLTNNSEEENVFFVNSDYLYEGYYTRMQVLLKDKKLKIIEMDELETIPEGAYFLGYNSERAEEQIHTVGETVLTGRAFKLYREGVVHYE